MSVQIEMTEQSFLLRLKAILQRLFKSPKTHCNARSMLISLVTVIIFVIVQTFFFYYVASNTINVVIDDKADFANTYIKKDRDLSRKINEFYKSDVYRDMKEKEKQASAVRDKVNRAIIRKYVGITLITVMCMFLICIYIAVKKNSNSDTSKSEKSNGYSKIESPPRGDNIESKAITRSEWYGLAFIFGGYITEAIFFFGIVKQYQYVGDNYIVSELYERTYKQNNKRLDTGKSIEELCPK